MERPESSLRKYLDKLLDELKYVPRDVDVKAITSGGANFSSHLFKVIVGSPGRGTLHLFSKVAIDNAVIREQLPFDNLFLYEKLVYEELLKAYDDLQKKYGIPEKYQFKFAKYYGSSLERGSEVFVFEDLDGRGYQIYDRFECLDYDHVSENMKVLANFHALSFVLEKENPKLWEKFKNMKFPIEVMADLLKSDPENYLEGLSENQKNRIRQLLKSVGGMEAITKFYDPFGRNAILHGDFRPSNIMFKQEGKDIIVIPVDYQTVRIGSAMSDLLYFLMAATDGALRKQHYEDLLGCYHAQLARCLRYCGQRGYSTKVLQLHCCAACVKTINMLPLALLFAMAMYPVLVVPTDTAPSFATEDAAMTDMILRPSPQSTARLAELVEDCIRWGVL